MEKLWFKAKRYGWGWYPCSWQGWLVLALYVLFLVLVGKSIDSASHSVSDTLIGVLIPFLLLTGILLDICWKTGERPRWRWGR
jgi:hypothetical protein